MPNDLAGMFGNRGGMLGDISIAHIKRGTAAGSVSGPRRAAQKIMLGKSGAKSIFVRIDQREDENEEE